MPRPALKALEVADALEKRIRAGDYESRGGYLPSSRSLEDDEEIGRKGPIGAERGTIDRAKHLLKDRGLIEITRSGAKVKTPIRYEEVDIIRPAGRWRGFGAAVIRAGGEPYADVLDVGEVEAPPEAARWLGVPTATPVLRRHRVHGAFDGDRRVPMSVSMTWILLDAVERAPAMREMDTGSGGITQRLEDAGYLLWYEDVVTACQASAEEAGVLGVAEGFALTEVWRRTYDQRDRIVKASRRVHHPRRQELSYKYRDLPRDGGPVKPVGSGDVFPN